MEHPLLKVKRLRSPGHTMEQLRQVMTFRRTGGEMSPDELPVQQRLRNGKVSNRKALPVPGPFPPPSTSSRAVGWGDTDPAHRFLHQDCRCRTLDKVRNRCGLPPEAVSNEVVGCYVDSSGPDKTGFSHGVTRRLPP